MNFVFFSPHFPANGADFCAGLRNAGANVLGIGDAPYETLPRKLKEAMGEYYRIADMEDYDQTFRAIGHFIHKWGRIDRFESLNEHWLELEAQIRTDFNIYGTKLDYVQNLKRKSRMRAFFRKSGVATVPQGKASDRAGALTFLRRVGYPVVVKPDSGSGAAMTYKIGNQRELDAFLAAKPAGVAFVMEEFVDGLVVTYDGLANRDGEVIFAASTAYDQSVMDIVNTDGHMSYVTAPSIDPVVEEAGRKILKAFDVRERFFHIELFQTRNEGRIIALEINMRPPGAWITDAINYAYDVDVYRMWADMVVKDAAAPPAKGKYFAAYASRKDHLPYRHRHEAVLAELGPKLLHHQRVEKIFSRAMGHYAYQFRAKKMQDVRAAIDYIHAPQDTKKTPLHADKLPQGAQP
ncbi:MAG: ATP-grasp domain-containing protein [Rhizobiales bacterium]|nr:ATP-grasp domain-containing protein [Hyphomicrobiales bacterium]